MNSDQFTFQQSAPGGPRGDRELGTGAMLSIVDSLSFLKQSAVNNLTRDSQKYMFADSLLPFEHITQKKANNPELIYIRALERIKTAKNVIMSNYRMDATLQDEINKYWVEIHKKYAIPVACIVFILIGAPLGVMVRKGGFGVAASISLFFFVLYWAFLIGGEKLADRNIITPFWGMWSANILLGIVGILLTTKTVQETVTINLSFLKKLIPKQWREIQNEEAAE
jgi:lipopolysaccharide export system permease protein